MNNEIIIKNGKIIDGTGNPGYYGEIVINKGKITQIKSKINELGKIEIDATDLIVCPGFIDAHSHTDFILPFFNTSESFVRQGITTCVIGMCGNSLAPIHPDKVEEFKQTYENTLPQYKTLKIPWYSYGEYLDELEKRGSAINLAGFVGYESIRIAGGAGYENRPPTAEELEKMKNYLTEAMEVGAFGMSTGLIYAPQVYAKTEELIELVKILTDYHGLYFSHIRGEGDTVINAVKELIEIVKKSGCSAGHIAHHKVIGKKNWGKSVETLHLIEEANKQGLDITCDSYPYKRSMTWLVTALPAWAREGGNEKTLSRLRNSDEIERIKKYIEESTEDWENLIRDEGFENIYIAMANSDEWKDYKGKSIPEITQIKGYKDDLETFLKLLIDEKLGIMVTSEGMHEEDIKRILKNRYQMIGTDGAGIPYLPSLGAIHPRYYGTYPRILSKFVREEELLLLEQAIRKMTSFPAQRLGLRDRGIIKEGTWADIVIFNPNTIKDKATYENPHQFPEGIPYVIVNGVIIVDNNKQNENYPGKVLRRPT